MKKTERFEFNGGMPTWALVVIAFFMVMAGAPWYAFGQTAEKRIVRVTCPDDKVVVVPLPEPGGKVVVRKCGHQDTRVIFHPVSNRPESSLEKRISLLENRLRLGFSLETGYLNIRNSEGRDHMGLIMGKFILQMPNFFVQDLLGFGVDIGAGGSFAKEPWYMGQVDIYLLWKATPWLEIPVGYRAQFGGKRDASLLHTHQASLGLTFRLHERVRLSLTGTVGWGVLSRDIRHLETESDGSVWEVVDKDVKFSGVCAGGSGSLQFTW